MEGSQEAEQMAKADPEGDQQVDSRGEADLGGCREADVTGGVELEASREADVTGSRSQTDFGKNSLRQGTYLRVELVCALFMAGL